MKKDPADYARPLSIPIAHLGPVQSYLRVTQFKEGSAVDGVFKGFQTADAIFQSMCQDENAAELILLAAKLYQIWKDEQLHEFAGLVVDGMRDDPEKAKPLLDKLMKIATV